MTNDTTKPSAARSGFRLGRLGGVVVRVDWSLLFIFVLVAVSLGSGAFPEWHPTWSYVTVWSVALLASVLFFGSVLLHELAHAWVGRTQGIEVPEITLFMFGGMAHMKTEPPSARAELLMAAVGPAMSFAIGVVATALGSAMVPADVVASAASAHDPLAPLHGVSPLATLLLWLGPINVMLAVFNLLPGFPLDGGRVLRAVLWGLTGNRLKATLWASQAGIGFAWLLIAAGVAMVFGVWVPWLGRGLFSGMWLILIGWFLSNAARASYQREVMQRSLEGITVGELMRSQFDAVQPSTTISSLVHDHVTRTGQRTFPVVQDGTFVGLVTLEQVRAIEREQRDQVLVGEVMTAADSIDTLAPETPAVRAVADLSHAPERSLPVLENGRVRGLLRQQDVSRWIALERAS